MSLFGRVPTQGDRCPYGTSRRHTERRLCDSGGRDRPDAATSQAQPPPEAGGGEGPHQPPRASVPPTPGWTSRRRTRREGASASGNSVFTHCAPQRFPRKNLTPRPLSARCPHLAASTPANFLRFQETSAPPTHSTARILGCLGPKTSAWGGIHDGFRSPSCALARPRGPQRFRAAPPATVRTP